MAKKDITSAEFIKKYGELSSESLNKARLANYGSVNGTNMDVLLKGVRESNGPLNTQGALNWQGGLPLYPRPTEAIAPESAAYGGNTTNTGLWNLFKRNAEAVSALNNPGPSANSISSFPPFTPSAAAQARGAIADSPITPESINYGATPQVTGNQFGVSSGGPARYTPPAAIAPSGGNVLPQQQAAAVQNILSAEPDPLRYSGRSAPPPPAGYLSTAPVPVVAADTNRQSLWSRFSNAFGTPAPYTPRGNDNLYTER